jgi:formate/nitrite transporter FocA (FNT family)
MVALGTILGMISTSAFGKIASIWLPVSTFFALAFEHSIVNMFVMPTAMLLGADITVGQWLFWNQIPVTLGNIVGGAVFTGLLLHYCFKPVPPVIEEKSVHNVTRTAP